MTLLETLYDHLKQNDLTPNAEHFSTVYLKRSKSWYAVQKHGKRDIGIAAAIQCLRYVRWTQNYTTSLSASQCVALSEAERLITRHIEEVYHISKIIESEAHLCHDRD